MELEGRLSPRTLTTLPSIVSALAAVQADESAIFLSLSKLLSDRQPIANSLVRLKYLIERVEELEHDADGLVGKVSVTARTAELVGGKVSALDEEMRRVREAADRVGLIADLKSSLSDIQSDIEAQDWESATRHCSRAMLTPKEVIEGAFAEKTVPTADLPLPPSQTLEDARKVLLQTFQRHFSIAAQKRDSAAVSRFFKLFPAIGWEQEGLQAYSDFVVELVRGRQPISGKTSSPMYYISMMTALFESIALIVDQHQPVVEKYYGPGKMIPVVVRLLQEADKVVRILIEGWEDERAMKRKLTEARDASFAALTPAGKKQSNGVEDEGPDPREIDKVLTEAAGMAGRWGLFRRFLLDRLKRKSAPSEDDVDAEPTADTVQSSSNGEQSEEDQATTVLTIIDESGCQKDINHLLKAYYEPLELWYLRSVIDRAHRMSSVDSSQPTPQTTTPDDSFYILRLVLHRLISSSSLPTMERMCKLVEELMERDYGGVMRRKLEDVYRGVQSMPASKEKERVERESRTTFIICLNDLDVSASHMERLTDDLLESPLIPQNFLLREIEAARSRISSLLSLVPKFRSILKSGVEQLFNQLVRPRLRALMSDIYKDVTYVLDEDGYANAEYQDVVKKRFVKSWEAVLEGFKDSFTEVNFRMFWTLAIDVIVRPWEKLVLGMRFTELGAIRFDREVRSISSYLTSQTSFGDAREKLQRLQQIATVLNLDAEESVDEFYTSSGIAWRLSASEARSIAALKA
ncbi:COG4-domain-containing protein [Dacryopinax primogenitus]|uniref:Conserved oligomeric Golgi complex subunit 4 n=1 Tax=Dacryopinax primogenitus (strain DJM 731) TaxID=1858805 RepID=M5GEP9_DACPD|nr:COG4-domain-containing protein [Dacryopinax primogenitus]EJU05592.1 COG4-domain-containing protein [Dacryopinax primogenitus]